MLEERLRIHTQPIRHPRDVVEVRNDLNRIMDRAIVKPMPAQVVEILWIHPALIARELLRERTQRLFARRQRRLPPVRRYRMDQLIGGLVVGGQRGHDLDTEVVSVCLRSIDAADFPRDHGGEELAVRA